MLKEKGRRDLFSRIPYEQHVLQKKNKKNPPAARQLLIQNTKGLAHRFSNWTLTTSCPPLVLKLHECWKQFYNVQKAESQHGYEGADSAPSWRAQQTVALWWPWYTRMASPVDIVHSLAVVSEEAENREQTKSSGVNSEIGGSYMG